MALPLEIKNPMELIQLDVGFSSFPTTGRDVSFPSRFRGA